MALDTRGFMSGFSQGFGMVDQYQQRQWQKEQAEKQAALQQERLGIQDERYEREFGLKENQIAADQAYRDSQLALQQEQMALRKQELAQQQERYNAEMGLKQGQHDQQTKINDLRIKQAGLQQQRTEDENYLKGLYADWGSTGSATITNSEELDRLQAISDRNPDLVAGPIRKNIQQRKAFAANQQALDATISAMQKLFTPGQNLTPADEDALLNANADITRAAAPEALQATQVIDRVFDPQDDFNENSPEALQAWNLVFGDMVGEGKRIVGVYPGKTPGTITLDLDTGDGKTNPMTVNRGTEEDGDNDVLEIPVDKAIETVSGFKAAAYQFALDDEARSQVLDFGARRGLYTANESKAISSRHVLDSYTTKLQEITSDADLSVNPEQMEKAIQSLRLNTAMSMGIHPDNIETALFLNSRNELTAAQLASLALPRSDKETPKKADGGDKSVASAESATGLTPPPLAGLTPPEPQSAPENRPVFHWQGDIESQMEDRKQQEAQRAEKRKQQEAEAQRKQTIAGIQQRLKQLAPAVQAGDPTAQQLAQKLSAQLRETLNSQ